MNALVIGSEGVIGSHLLRALIAAGHTVNGTTRRNTPDRMQYDLLEGGALPPCDVAYLCAAVLRGDPEQAAPDEWAVNVDATLETMRALMERGTFAVFPSSIAVERRDDPYAHMKAHVECALWNTAAAVVRLGDDIEASIKALIQVGESRSRGLTKCA